MNDFWQHLQQHFALPVTNPVLIFALILFIILLAPILMAKLKLPAIVGFILAGIAIGPFGFDVLRKNAAIELFSTIGLLYIMFIAGLELDLDEFREKRHRSLVFGLLTFAIPISLGLPVCHFILGYSWLTTTLISIMFATHTLVAYPIVSKYKIAKNEAVAITVGGTILTDTAVLILLAVILASKNGELTFAFWRNLILSLGLYMFIMFGAMPFISKWFLAKLSYDRTSQYVYILSVVFFSAFLSQLAGVEPIIGAFMAGLALNRLIPHRSVLMHRIEFVGNAIFIPFFLISVGMLVNLKVVFRGFDAMRVTLFLTTVALLGKWLAALITQRAFGYSIPQRGLIFGLSSAHAAATLAIILVGYQNKILDDNVLNGTIMLILVTCIVASLATERASKKVVKSVV